MKNNFFNRLVSFAVAVCLVFAMSVTAFAAESEFVGTDEEVTTTNDEGVSPAWSGTLTGSKTFSGTSTHYTLTTSSSNWGANFYVKVSGNSGVSYYVEMTAANGSEYCAFLTSSDGWVNIANMTYAKAGSYTFYIYTWESVSNSTTLSVKVTD